MPYKRCTRCSETKAVSEFYPDRTARRKDGLFPWCRPCTLAYNRAYIKRNPEGNRERAKRARIKAKYGITWAEREQMLANQDGRCAICRDPFNGTKGTHTDHDHRSGSVRALLCESCNLGLGNFKDQPSRLRAAIEYLRRHGIE